MKIERKVPSLQFTELDPAIQEVIMKLLPSDQYQSYIYYVGNNYIGCQQGEEGEFFILRNCHDDFARIVPWPGKSA